MVRKRQAVAFDPRPEPIEEERMMGDDTEAIAKERAEEALAERARKRLGSRTTTFTTEMVKREPVPVRTLFGSYIVAGKVNVLGAAGGVGKTTLVAGLALAGATGKDFLEKPTNPFSTVVVNTEEEDEDFQRRLHTWHELSGLETNGRIHHIDARGMQLVRLLAGRPQADFEAVEELAWQVRALVPDGDVLIPLETVSRLSGGQESNDGAIELVRALEHLAQKTKGGTPLPLAHVGKENARNRVVDQYATRNASALTDNARSFMLISRPPPAEAEESELPEHEDFFGLYHPKHNLTRGERVIYLERHCQEEGLHSAYFTRWSRPLRAAAPPPEQLDPERAKELAELEMGRRLHRLVARLTRLRPDSTRPAPVTMNTIRESKSHRGELGGISRDEAREQVEAARRNGFLKDGDRKLPGGHFELLPGEREV
jgi:RecA-family ATPase